MTLQDKLKEAQQAYQQGVAAYQKLQHELVQQEGAIKALSELVEEEANDAW